MVHGYIISWYPHVTLPVTSPVHQCPQLLSVITLPVAKEQARGGRRSCKPAQGFPGFPTCFLDLCNGISPLQRMWNVYTLYMQCDVFRNRNQEVGWSQFGWCPQLNYGRFNHFAGKLCSKPWPEILSKSYWKLETGNYEKSHSCLVLDMALGVLGVAFSPFSFPDTCWDQSQRPRWWGSKTWTFGRSYDSPDCHSTNEEKKRWPRSSMKTRDAKAPSQRTTGILCSPGRSLPFVTWEMFSNSWLTLGFLYHPWLDKARVQLAKWLFPE